jgi:hypothetical protein
MDLKSARQPRPADSSLTFDEKSSILMRLRQLALFSSILACLTIPSFAATHTRRGPTSRKIVAKHTVVKKVQSQRTIDDARAAEIQAALVKAGYLSGTPSGHWDAASVAAMTKVQADNGWQTKLVPDSRALIKLGLGPSTASRDLVAGPSASLVPAQSDAIAEN